MLDYPLARLYVHGNIDTVDRVTHVLKESCPFDRYQTKVSRVDNLIVIIHEISNILFFKQLVRILSTYFSFLNVACLSFLYDFF